MHGNHSACELLPPFPTRFYGLLISCYLSPTLPVLPLSSIHNLTRKLRIYFRFLPHCSAQQLQRCFRLIFQHPYRHCPQARAKSSSWTHHLDVLTLCGMIYRKAASIMLSLTPCIDEMLKIQNCQDGTVHSLQLKQLSADSPKHTHTNKAAAPKTKTQSISANDGKTRGCFPQSEKWPHHQSPLSNQHWELSALSSGCELRGSH